MTAAASRGILPAKGSFTQGVLFVVISGILYGTLVIFGKLAYTTGIEPLPLLFLRYTITATIMLAAALALRPQVLRLPPRKLGIGLGLGLLYATQSYLYFVGFRPVDGAVTGILFNTFPLHIAILAAILLGERMSWQVVLALALGISGVALTLQPSSAAVDPTGAALILISAFGYSVYVVAARKTTPDLEPESVAAFVFLGASMGFTAALLGSGGMPGAVNPDSLAYAVALAVLATLLPILLFLKGLKIVGASRAGILGTFEPLTTVVLSAIVLGSVLGPLQLIGGALILGASVLVHRSGVREPEQLPAEVPRE